MIFFRQARPPVKRRRDFGRSWVKTDLLLKSGLGFGVPALAQTQPRYLPVRVGGAARVWKTLLQLPVGVDGFVVVGFQQIEIALRQQRLLQPRLVGAVWRSSARFRRKPSSSSVHERFLPD